MKKILLILALMTLLSIQVAYAVEHLTKNDFKEPSPSVKIANKYVSKFYAKPKDKVEIQYIIEPKDEDCAKKLDNRYYKFLSDLENPEIRVVVYYRNDGIVHHPIPDMDELGDNYLKIKLVDTKYGVEKIRVNVTGYAPEITERFREIKALYFDISDADADVLANVTIKVFNLTRFKEDMNHIESELNKLEQSILTLKADYDTYLLKLRDLKNYLSIAYEYLNLEEYEKCNEKLLTIEENLEVIKNYVNRFKANTMYTEFSSKLDNISVKFDEIDLYLSKIRDVVNYSIYMMLMREYKDLKSIYNALRNDLTITKAYINIEDYNSAIKILENDKMKLNNLEIRCNKLYDQIMIYTKESKKSFKLNWLTVVVIALIIIAAIAVIRFKRRRGKWDELG